MPLSPGTRLGSYEVVSVIGAGGMGEVYRARDTKLDRHVAIKVLPESVATDPERLARFHREAQLLASLNHPGIAHLHGYEESNEIHALVMELVDGATLADRIAQGPMPLDEALPIAKQIAEAIEAAHEQGIVHRDLKPANVKVREDGTIKVLDFGLAKAIAPVVELSPGQPLSPTITAPAMTGLGVILGTAAYMSPEQASGKPTDRRTDIWAFGCLLYEMLTGQMAFRGDTVAGTLAAVIRAEPDWALLPAATPQHVRALLSRCLQKDRRQRLQAIGDARIALEEVLSGARLSAGTPRQALAWTIRLAYGVTGVLIGAGILGGAWSLRPSPAAPPRPVTRFTITLPPGQQLARTGMPALALSADGTRLAYIATPQGSDAPQIHLRAMESSEVRRLSGTEGAAMVFFSPDGQWLGFLAHGKLKKISVRGGVAQTLADVVNPTGATWTGQHTIVVASYLSALLQVSDEGGALKPLTRFETGETAHSWPESFPGANAVLFSALSASPTAIAVQHIDTGVRRNLIQAQGEAQARFIPSGHLVYAQAGSLMAVPFDPTRLEARGAAVPVVPGILQYPLSGGAQYSVSDTGTLAYVSGNPQGNRPRILVWVSRAGKEQALGAPARAYNQPRLSPDGGRVAVDIVDDERDMQVWLYDRGRDTLSPFTFRGVNRHAVWTRDGKRIAFMSDREGAQQIFWKLADGSGESERLTQHAPTDTADILNIPYSFSPDGRLLASAKVAPSTGAEFWMVRVGDPSPGPGQDRKSERFLQTRAADGGPQLSPDGHWLAYASEESRRREIYVQSYPGPGGKWQISTDGGNEPQWNPNGRELFYRSGNKMMAVDIRTQDGFAAGKPRQLFEGNYLPAAGGYVRPNYDVSHDGQRFLMLKMVEQEEAPLTQINVVLNWFEDLKRLVPAK